jgi:hypothetical protein
MMANNARMIDTIVPEMDIYPSAELLPAYIKAIN